MNNLKNTRKKLTVIFTIIIAILFLVIANVFFVFKFFSDQKNIENDYKNVEEIIKNKNDDIITFLEENENLNSLSGNSQKENLEEIDKILDFTKRLLQDKDSKFESDIKTVNIEEVLVEGKTDFPFFNHKLIVFSDNNRESQDIIYSNIEDNENIDFKSYIKNENKIIYEDKLIILKTNIGNNKILVFSERNYPKQQVFLDILYSFILILLFSIIFYFVGKIFIGRVLKPVEENIAEMNNFIDNAGHELKTPLAAINSSSNLLKELKKYENELVQEIIDETKKANEIIGALRDLTKISKNSTTEYFSTKETINNVIASEKNSAKEKNISINIKGTNDLKLNANKNYFYILIRNIISNTIKYNKENGNVIIQILDNSIIINDSGIGIPKDQIKNIYQRFYRVKNHKDIKGYGLGLSMVEKICKIYNWKIEVESIEGVGTKMKINF